MSHSLRVLDVDTLKRVVTLSEAKGFAVDLALSHDIEDSLYRELKSIDKTLLEEYYIDKPSNPTLLSHAFDCEVVTRKFLLNEGSRLAELVLQRRSVSKVLSKVRAFNKLELLGSRVFWRLETTPFLRTESRDYNVQLMPKVLRMAVKPTNGLFVNLVFDDLEIAANCFRIDEPELFNVYGELKGDTPKLSALFGYLYGASLFEVNKELENSFPSMLIGESMKDALLAVERCPRYLKMVEELKDQEISRSGNSTVFGRHFSKTEKHTPAYYFTHGSCQDLLDMFAVSIFDRFGSGVDVVLVDHHSILLDCVGCQQVSEIVDLCSVEVSGVKVSPTAKIGEHYLEVSSDRPSVSLLYGKWSR